MTYSSLEIDRKTKPVQVSVKKGKHVTLHQTPVERDFDFYELIQESLGNEVFSSIFLVGRDLIKNGRPGRYRFYAAISVMYFMEIICLPREPVMEQKKK